MSPGSLWQSSGPRVPMLALYLAKLADGPSDWLGMVFDYAVRRWIRLDDIRWDPVKQRLTFYHMAKGGFDERDFSGGLVDDQLQGTYLEAGSVHPWQVDRVLPHGVWKSPLPFGPFALSNTGKWEDRAALDAETWTGRLDRK